MNRRSMLALSGAALTTALAGCNALGTDGTPTAGPTDEPTDGTPTDDPTPSPTSSDPAVPADIVNGSFEDDWTAWTVGRELPEDPNREGSQAVASEVAVTTVDATDGTTSCRILIDGSQDDGTVWVAQPVDLSTYSHLAVDYRVSGSFNEIRNAAVYTGPDLDRPLTETDFDTSKSLEGHDASGWKTFTYPVDHDGPGIVAVGWSIVWETTLAALFDDVRLSTEAPETVTPSPSTSTDTESGGNRTI